jgi:FMN reductase
LTIGIIDIRRQVRDDPITKGRLSNRSAANVGRRAQWGFASTEGQLPVTPTPLPSCTTATSLPLNLVAVSGNVRAPSRTAALVRAMAESTANHIRVSQTFLSMTDVASSVMSALTRDRLAPDGLACIRQIEDADILILGSPIYRASYTGAVKHLFDLVDYRALAGAVGVIGATGGVAFHALATEHQFRPLLGFFGIIGVPTTVFALETDFDGTTLTSARVRDRIEQAAVEVAAFAPLAARRQSARLEAARLEAARLDAARLDAA